MSLGPENVTSWIERIREDIEGLQRGKKELRKEVNEARLQVGLLETEVGTEIGLLELEGMEIKYGYLDLEARTLEAEQRFLGSQLSGVRSELLALTQFGVSLDCQMNEVRLRCSDTPEKETKKKDFFL